MTWARHPGDSKFHDVTDINAKGSTLTRCDGRWPAGADVELHNNPPAAERCGLCTKRKENAS